ncbi:hypothetical protein ACEWY4_026621 [Coilia grayii]|uniref:RING-type domain-containing protein n=1 Tax=Coilia grayii TaxID=363190 RepID=A0ABD1IQ55_9TELE
MAAAWICCNNCFGPPSVGNELAVSTCGHIICSRCFQKGNNQPGQCGICKAKCHLSRISDKSSAEVKALFSDHGSTTTKYFSEIRGVLLFQARHQKRLLTHYQQRSEKLEEYVLKMKQEIQELNKKISQQNMYIHKLESSVHQSFVSLNLCMFCLSKPDVSPKLPRLSVISPPQDGSIEVKQQCWPNILFTGVVVFSICSRDFSCSIKDSLMNQSMTLMSPRGASWETPVFKAPFRYSSLSSLHPL